MTDIDQVDEQSHADSANNSDNEDTTADAVATAPSLYTRPAHFRQTRKRGKIIKTVNERYLRDDLGFGCHYVDADTTKRRVQEAVVGKPRVIETTQELLSLLKPCKPSSLVVCDTNVLLHNLDVLEQGQVAMPNLVIPQTALMECRANRMVAYDRTVDLLRSVGGGNKSRRCGILFADPHHVDTANVAKGQTANDENDERIRNVAEYYGEHLQGSNIRVILLTDDAGSREIAKGSKLYEAKSVRSWVQELESLNPGLSLSDLVAQYGTSGAVGGGKEGDVATEASFPPHVDATELSRGVQSGLYHRAVIRSTDKDKALVTIRRGEERVAVTIQGSNDRNRAVDGDVVAIALHPLDQWVSADGIAASEVKEVSKNTGIAAETAEPAQSEMENVPEVMSMEDATKSLRPTGKVVGILRRNFTNQSGSIYETNTGLDSSEMSEREQIAAKYEREHPDGSITCVFFPVNKKIPPVLIRTTQRDRLISQRIVVTIDAWPAHSPYPLGHYVRTIGLAGSKDVETEVLLQEHNIPHEPFPPAVLACLPPEDYSIDTDNSPGRLDLRHLPILSIDPPNCQDIDDALHCIVLPNGNYQVGVSHYVC